MDKEATQMKTMEYGKEGKSWTGTEFYASLCQSGLTPVVIKKYTVSE